MGRNPSVVSLIGCIGILVLLMSCTTYMPPDPEGAADSLIVLRLDIGGRDDFDCKVLFKDAATDEIVEVRPRNSLVTLPNPAGKEFTLVEIEYIDKLVSSSGSVLARVYNTAEVIPSAVIEPKDGSVINLGSFKLNSATPLDSRKNTFRISRKKDHQATYRLFMSLYPESGWSNREWVDI